MASIPKIVSTPLKWVSKKVIHHTLLKFPGGDEHPAVACVFCPEMCRFSCPTAVASSNDAVTPCNKMGLLYKEEKWPGRLSSQGPLWPVYDCTGCGRCTEYCLYEMPVADRLFEARQKFKWDRADAVLAELPEQLDPVGDLADELGESEIALERLKSFLNRSRSQSGVHEIADVPNVQEAKSLVFLEKHGHTGTLSWEAVLARPLSESLRQRLQGHAWLLHESPWYNRHLNRAAHLQTWVAAQQAAGVLIQLPFAHGRDCIDCGGEGAYSKLFPEQARTMAQEFWQRDQHRAQGILCLSQRCATHLRAVLGPLVPVIVLN